jgi:transketolase
VATSVAERPTRDAYGHALLELVARRDDVLVLDSDLSRSTRTDWLQAEHPDRFVNFGIAEANMVSAAAGMALGGFVPFVTTYAIFIGRAFDQIRQSVAFPHANVKIVATHAGLAASHDGGSHQGIEDLALMRVLPGLTILSPADYDEAKAAVHAAAEHPGPVYLRLGKHPQPCFTGPGHAFRIGETRTMREGTDCTICATGALVHPALVAAERLAERGVSARVINVSTIKPLDEEAIVRAARETGCVVVAEEHSRIGGLGSAVAELTARRHPVPVVPVAMNDCFGETGEWHELLARYGLDSQGIESGVRAALAQREGALA